MFARVKFIAVVTLLTGGSVSGPSFADEASINDRQFEVFLACAEASVLSTEDVEYVGERCSEESDMVPCVARSSGKRVEEGQLTAATKEALLKCMSDALEAADS